MNDLEALEAAISTNAAEQDARRKQLFELNLASPPAADAADADIIAAIVAERRRGLIAQRLDALAQERESLFRRRAALTAPRLASTTAPPDPTGRYS